MKKTVSSNHILWFLTAMLALGTAACKKDNGGNNTNPPPPDETMNLTISDLKAKSTSASVTVGEEGKLFKVKGVVISDKDAKNIDAKTAVIAQADNAAGIVVNFAAAHSLALDAEVEIDVSNQKLLKQNGEIVLDAVPVANAKIITPKKAVTAKTATITEIVTNKDAWNGTLVSVGEGAFAGTGKYNGTITYNAQSASIKSVITAGASFDNADYPASVSKITGIVRSNGNELQLNIRNIKDVVTAENTGKTITIDFSNPLTDTSGKALNHNDAASIIQAGGFKTTPDIGIWGRTAASFGTDPSYPFVNVKGDEAVTKGNTYFYITVAGSGNLGYRNALSVAATQGQLKGLKKVTVTFAYSMAPKGKVKDGNNWYEHDAAPVSANSGNKVGIGIAGGYTDPANDEIYILENYNDDGVEQIEKMSPKYTEAGKDYTFAYTMPTEAEARAAAEARPDEINVEKYMQSPTLLIYNRCTSKDQDQGAFPVIIKKVVLEF